MRSKASRSRQTPSSTLASPPKSPPTSPMPKKKKNKRNAGSSNASRANDKHWAARLPESIKPLGNGPHFSYTRTTTIEQTIEQPSPRPLTPSVNTDNDELEEGSESSESPVSLPDTRPAAPVFMTIKTTHIFEATFTVEEMSDFGDKDIGRLDIIRPHEIVDAQSERSHSRPRQQSDLDRRFVERVRDLQFDDIESSEGSDLDEDEYQENIRKQREARRCKRMSMGSVSKRTISERDSGSDREDMQFVGADDTTSSERRTKRKLERRSLLFQDPPPRIDEMDEPEEMEDSEVLAKELPFYSFMSMQVDSP